MVEPLTEEEAALVAELRARIEQVSALLVGMDDKVLTQMVHLLEREHRAQSGPPDGWKTLAKVTELVRARQDMVIVDAATNTPSYIKARSLADQLEIRRLSVMGSFMGLLNIR